MERKDERTVRMTGTEALNKLNASRIALFGLGGVGSYIAEALARAGVGELYLIDGDRVDETNINRQLYALRSTVGMRKTDAAEDRCRDISEQLIIHTLDHFVTADEIPELMSSFGRLDYVADAVDTVSVKIGLAEYCERNRIPLISCCGTGNKLDPSRFEIADIYATSVCPLCRVLRRELKARNVQGLTVCYSKEEPVKTGTRSPGSISFVPSSAGLLIASHIVRELIRM